MFKKDINEINQVALNFCRSVLYIILVFYSKQRIDRCLSVY